MPINRFFLMAFKFNQLFAHILHSLQGVNVKATSVHKLMQENTNCFFVFQDGSIPEV